MGKSPYRFSGEKHMMNQKNNCNTTRVLWIWRIVFFIGTVLCIIFIFSRSLSPAQQSNHESGKVLGLIQTILDNIGLSSIGITHHFVRKMAHFIEYFILGIFLTGTIRSFTADIIRYFSVSLFLGLLVPVCDEFIQSFISGRSSQVSDVLLDFSGAVCGMVLCYLGILIYNRWKQHRRCL